MVLLWLVTGSFPRSSQDGTFHGFIIEEQIVVHQITLDGIATPYPTVALDAVDKEFTVVRCMVYAPTSQMRFSSSSLHLNEPRYSSGRYSYCMETSCIVTPGSQVT